MCVGHGGACLRRGGCKAQCLWTYVGERVGAHVCVRGGCAWPYPWPCGVCGPLWSGVFCTGASSGL